MSLLADELDAIKFEKTANLWRGLLRGARPAAKHVNSPARNSGNPVTGALKGAWNFAFGGRTHPATGAWDPLHGVKTLGVPKQQHASGPLKGMYKYDPHTGEAALSDKRNIGEYLKQEWQGGTPTRADLAARHFAGKAKPRDQLDFATSKRWREYRKKHNIPWYANPHDKDLPRMNVGEYMQHATDQEKKVLGQINSMGTGEFMRKHPALAANLYGRKALYTGFLAGIPAYEAYDALKNNEGMHGESGRWGNVGSSLAAVAGTTATMPLGLVGSVIGGGVASRAGQVLGDRLDRRLGNRPFQELKAKNELLEQPV